MKVNPMANYTIVTSGKQCRVVLAGDLTAPRVPELQAALRKELVPAVTEVIFDLGQTATLDSSGIGLLIATNNSLARQQGCIRVQNVSPDLLRLLQSMRLVSRLNTTGRTP